MGAVVLWIGVAMAAAGFAGVVWCLTRAFALRNAARAGADPAPGLRRLAAWNSAAVGVAFLGLGVMVVGMVL